jgi:ribosomal protein L31E
MAEERVYNIPLRREALKASKWRRAKKAVTVLKAFIKSHAKVKTVKLSKWVNQAIWSRGSKYPPAKLSVKVSIDKTKSSAEVDLLELPKEALKEKKKKEEGKKEAKKLEKTEEKSEEKEEKKEKEKEKVEAPSNAPTAE